MTHADNLRQISDGFADAYGHGALPRTRRWLLSAAQHIEELERRLLLADRLADQALIARLARDARR